MCLQEDASPPLLGANTGTVAVAAADEDTQRPGDECRYHAN
jgi:hypothetical protein